jgi:hypothetical protein
MAEDRPFDTIVARVQADLFALLAERGCRPNSRGRAPCPIHGGDHPEAFHVRKDGSWQCYTNPACGGGADALDFLVRVNGGTPGEKEARTAMMYELAPRYGIELKPRRKDHGGAPAQGYQITTVPSQPTKAPDPYRSTKDTPDTSAMNGGEPLSAYPVSEPRALAAYPYHRATGELVAIKVRKPHPTRRKSFTWHHSDGRKSGEHDPLPDEYRELVYRLPELRMAADDGETLVAIGEGEKVADALRSLGFAATSHHGGASAKWTEGQAQHVAAFQRVVLFPDNDQPGRDHMAQCAATLARSCPGVELRTVTIKNEWGGVGLGDVADFIAAARAKGWANERIRNELQRRIDDAFASGPAANPATPASKDDDAPALEEYEHERRARDVRALTDVALYGPLGAWVRVWQPHTEASPLALYAVGLAALGAVIGRGAFLRVNADTHAPRLFVLLVGLSGRARKGVTISIVAELLAQIDPAFAKGNVVRGLSTAEGLIKRLRDPEPERLDAKGKEVPAVPGVEDKRLLVIVDEFAGVLHKMERHGNDLSVAMRDVWDGRSLQRLVAGEPMVATDPHVVLVGAITPSELRKKLSGEEVFNGFANRLLPIYAVSDQCIPFPGLPDPFELTPIVDELKKAVEWARAQRGEFSLTADAKRRWETLYPRLRQSIAQAEAVRALHERAAPYVLRVALLLAMLDRSRVVRPAHLDAAAALWQLAEGAWDKVYPDTPREGLAGKIEPALKEAGPDGLTRTQLRVRAGIGNSVAAADIARALVQLADEGLAVKLPPRPTNGRKAEVWVHAWHRPISSRDPGTMGDMGETGDKHLPPISPIPPISPMLPFAGTEPEDRAEEVISQISHISHVPKLREADEQLEREWGDDAA